MENDNRWERFTKEVAAAVVIEIRERMNREDWGPPKIAKRYMTVKECAEFTGFSEIAIYRKINKRQIPLIRHGRKIVFDREQIIDWNRSHAI